MRSSNDDDEKDDEKVVGIVPMSWNEMILQTITRRNSNVLTMNSDDFRVRLPSVLKKNENSTTTSHVSDFSLPKYRLSIFTIIL